MEDKNNNDSKKISKTHFFKLHLKIQNKYHQMQRRLEKSKSLDSLFTRSIYDTKKQSNGIDNDSKPKNEIQKCDLVIDDVPVQFVTVLDVSPNEVIISETKIIEDMTKKDTPKFFDDSFLNNFDKLSESSESYYEPSTPVTPNLFEMIGYKISAAKERRRLERQERNSITKIKLEKDKSETLNTVLSKKGIRDSRSSSRKLKVATVTVGLVEATITGEHEPTGEKKQFLSCRFKLGSEKRKSKMCKRSDFVAKWQQLFNFTLYEDHLLEVALWDKDIFIGKDNIDLFDLEKDKTHKTHLNINHEGTSIKVFMLVTVSGTVNSVVDVKDEDITQKTNDPFVNDYIWHKLGNNMMDVGFLSIVVFGARGLSGNDCYCLLELDNERVQTHTEPKTNEPNWMKLFTFKLTDITSILRITVYEERKSEDLGKISIPLLNIINGKKKWYALRESSQRTKAKGNNPRIQLEMRVTWNFIKASIRVINPKEKEYLKVKDKFDRHIFSKNVERAKTVVVWVMDHFQVLKKCFEWDSMQWNIIALISWLLFCWFFKPWMLPLMVLIPFVLYKPKAALKDAEMTHYESDDDETNDKANKNNATLKQKLQSLHDTVQFVQNFIGDFASLGESIKNLFNFSVPFVSWLAITLLLVIGLVMYLIPLTYILMIWGVYKFTRKIVWPNRIPNNEIMDLLSRVPNDETLLNCKILPLPKEENQLEIENIALEEFF